MKLRHLPSLCAALLALCPTLATAQTSAVPGYISYQGRVVDAAGANVGAGTPVNRTVIFRIWDNPSSTATANLIYSEAQTVTVSEGEFSVLVGQGVANTTMTFGYSESGTDKKLTDFSTAFTGSARYLGVTVASADAIATTDNEITPRQQIVSTPFAMRAKVAESVDANAISSAMLAIGAVGSTQLATGAVGSTQLAAASVTSAKLGTDAVLAVNIGNLSVTTAKVADNAVDNAKLRDSTGLSVIGRASSVVGDPADIVAATDGHVLRRSGTSLGFGTVGTAGIADSAITGAKIASDASLHIGKLGIGTNPASFPLTFANTMGDKISFNTDPVSGKSYGFGLQSSLLQFYTPTSLQDIAFGYGSSTTFAESMRIKGTGAVSITGSLTIGGNSVPTSEEAANLKIIRGSVNASGVPVVGGGFTATKIPGINGLYQITFTTRFTSTPVVTTSPLGRRGVRVDVYEAGRTTFPANGAETFPSDGGFTAGVLDVSAANDYNFGFSFIAIGPR